MLGALHRLVGHLRWADDKVLRALRSHPSPPERALDLYRHILGAEAVWLARIRGEPAPLAVWPTFDLNQAAAEAGKLHDALAALVAEQDEAALAREVAYTNSAGRSFLTPLGEILLHLCLHGVNHRGQVSLLLRQAGLEPVTTDYIEFVRGVPAATRAAGAGGAG